MDIKNNTEFDIKWLRQKGFVGENDCSESVIPRKSEVFRYKELMDYDGYKEIKVLITLDLVRPTTSRICFQYCDSHGSLKHREYNGDIMSPEMLILLLEAISPELAKKFKE